MSDKDMFDEQTETQPAGDPSTPPSNPFVDKLMEIQNENGEPKYKDVETALEALKASQQFIEQLKSEKHEVENKLTSAKTELEKMGSIEDFVKRLSPEDRAAHTDQKETPKESEGFSEEKIAELVKRQWAEQTTAQKQAQNLEMVTSKLSETYGDKAPAFIRQRAKELNTTPAELQKISQTNPAMALSLLSGGQTSSVTNPSTSTNIPPTTPANHNPRPTVEKGKGIARGGMTNKEMVERWRASKEYTNKRLEIES